MNRRGMKPIRSIMAVLVIGASLCASTAQAAKRLRVADGGRYLEYDGEPFFYLGDTAWELFHRLNREEADRYLKNRADKGYTVIQAVALGWSRAA